MALEEITEGHFDGGHNLNRGQRNRSDTTLEEFLGKFKAGREAFAAAGDLAVAFATPFGSADYTVKYSFEDVSGGANDLVGQVKATTRLAAGFTVTIAGTTPNGILHWIAIED